MDALEAIKFRRSVRTWTDEDVSEEDLSQILEAGRWSPSPLNSQPWHFIVVRSRETIEKLCRDAREGAFLKLAKVLIVVVVDKKVVTESDLQNSERLKLIDWLSEHDQYVYSGALAIGNMWLISWSLGLGACWVTLERSSTYKLLEIPEGKEIVGCLALGHILGTPTTHKETDRKSLSELVSYEKYSNKI